MAEAHQKAHGSKEDASAFFETLATDNNTAAAVGSPPRQQQERNPNQAQQPEVANNEDEEMQQLGQNHDNNNDFSTDLVGDSDLSEGSSDKDLDSAEYGGGEGLDGNVVAGEDDWNNDGFLNQDINTSMRAKFKSYCKEQATNGLPFLTKEQIRGIQLLDILKRKKAPLDTYDELMLWYHRSNGNLEANETLQNVDKMDHIGRGSLIKVLKKRYNMDDRFATKKALLLPHSQQNLELVCHDAWGCIESLLTDPRVTDDDYLFFDNDPTAEPPETIGSYADLNTGKGYREAVKTYKKGIKKRVVLPIVLYIDGADTGAMKSMPVTAVKMALGIHTRKYRDQDQAWRVLGFVASAKKAKAKGGKILKQSGHVAAQQATSSSSTALEEDDDDEEESKKVADDQGKPADFHAMLDVILESLVDVQKRGFVWDLRYKGRTWKDLEFVPYIAFVKCDNKEADTLCGAYNNYGKGVKHLCRYCHCPNEESDNPEARFPWKTVSQLKPLCDLQDLDALKKISQHCIQNCTYKLRFSPISTRGIHGATPSELLHQVLLGLFAYVRDVLYEQVGPDSHCAQEIDNLAQLFGGTHFARQCESDMPLYNCTDGIREGRITAKEYRGVLLAMTMILRSTHGRQLIVDEKKMTAQDCNEWADLVEILLCWEAFLGQPKISVQHVAKLATRNRYIMWLMRKRADRKTGRGLRIIKFHALVHMVGDIVLFGVPMEFDTGSNESGHKLTKIAALLTQKISALFDWQTSIRLDEFLLIDMALAEIRGYKLWDYYDQPARQEYLAPPNLEAIVTGATINIFQEKNNPQVYYSVGVGSDTTIRIPHKKPWDEQILHFLHDLQSKLTPKWGDKLKIRSEHHRNGQIYRGHPDYRGSPWRDWVLIDWGGRSESEETVTRSEPEAGLIWCFVVLENLPKSNKKKKKHKQLLRHGGLVVQNGVYAVVECSRWVSGSNQTNSRLLRKLTLEMASNVPGSTSTRRKFFLVEVEKIKGPLFVVPDIGCRNKRNYFQIKPRAQWVDVFGHWLEQALPDEYLNDKAGLQFGLHDN